MPRCDAIFVFGHNNPDVAHHSAKLFAQERAPVVLVSGGVGPKTELPSEYASEADHYAGILKTRGVPESCIILEDRATNTLENVQFGMTKLIEALKDVRSVIAVAVPPLLRRSLLTLRRHYPNVTVYGSAHDMRSQWTSDAKRTKRMCGEIDRLRRYSTKGDIAPVEIPPDVQSAYEFLSEQCA